MSSNFLERNIGQLLASAGAICVWPRLRRKKEEEKLCKVLRSVSLIFNRPGVAGAFLQSPPLLIHWLSDPFVQISSKHCQSQTRRARELKFWEFIHLSPCVTYHMSHVRCQVSGVRWDKLGKVIFFIRPNQNSKPAPVCCFTTQTTWVCRTSNHNAWQGIVQFGAPIFLASEMPYDTNPSNLVGETYGLFVGVSYS